jgi:hypothetical protein
MLERVIGSLIPQFMDVPPNLLAWLSIVALRYIYQLFHVLNIGDTHS